jgi:uncharacterized protein (DUF952 family)
VTEIYKILTQAEMTSLRDAGRFSGSGVDLRDGYIHFSTTGQVAETAQRHFSGQTGLWLVAVEAEPLGEALRYDVSRGGALFPHLYRALDHADVAWMRPIGTDAAGNPVLPPLAPEV